MIGVLAALVLTFSLIRIAREGGLPGPPSGGGGVPPGPTGNVEPTPVEDARPSPAPAALLPGGGPEGPADSRQPVSGPPGPFHFVDASAQAGLVHPTWCGRAEKPHLLESGGTGLALFDMDGDGDLDLYLVNGWRLDGPEVVERGRDRLYRNRGDGTFEDVTTPAGLGSESWGCGVAVGDVDGDGHPDLFVTNFGVDLLYRNHGDGGFTGVSGAPGIDGWSTGAVFFDSDGDGDEDLFVAGYVESLLDQVLQARPTLDWKGIKVMLGPFGLDGRKNRFFRNAGGGRFEDATTEAGLEDVGAFFSFTAAAFDIDVDGDLDLYVANDSNPNYLYKNDGKGRFQEVGLWSGAALDANGLGQAGMGLAVQDVDADGRPDVFVTNFAEDFCTFYRNEGRGLFTDESKERGVGPATYSALSWGTVLEDLDLDGDLDLFVANGHIYPQANQPGTGTSFEQENMVLMNEGGRFTEVGARSGPGLAVRLSSRGVAAGDLDGDGDIDLVVSNVDAPPTLLRNETPRRGAWLIVDAPGALAVEARCGERRLVRHRVHGGSYVSVSDSRFHFGLGPVERVDRLALRWPGGSETVLTGVQVDRVLKVAPGP